MKVGPEVNLNIKEWNLVSISSQERSKRRPEAAAEGLGLLSLVVTMRRPECQAVVVVGGGQILAVVVSRLTMVTSS